MGGLVEQQLVDATRALMELDADLAEQVRRNDDKVDQMELTVDEECSRILARRQPTASDLRLVYAVVKTITDLESRLTQSAQALTDTVNEYCAPAKTEHKQRVHFEMLDIFDDLIRYINGHFPAVTGHFAGIGIASIRRAQTASSAFV